MNPLFSRRLQSMFDIVKTCSTPNNERVYILFTCTFSNGLNGLLRIGIM